VRGLLGEHGIIAPRGIACLRRLLSELLADPQRSGLSGLLGETLVEIAGRLRFFDERIRAYDLRIGRVFAHDERCQRLAKVEGVGPLVATAIVAAVGNANEFKSGRELSAWLGWCRVSTSAAIVICCSGSASAVIATCAPCSFTGPAQLCAG
jgi:transposase